MAQILKPTVGALKAKESAAVTSSGVVARYVDVLFQKPDDCILVESEIWIREYPISSSETSPEYEENDWQFVGTTRDNLYRLYDILPGVRYEVAVIAVDNKGNKSELTTVNINTTGDVSMPPSIGGGIKDMEISGLSILNRPGESTFIGKDCVFVWNKISFTGGDVTGAGNELYGAGTILAQTTFRDYQVEMFTESGTLLRTEFVPSETYTYTYEKNYQDNNGTVLGTFKITVRARDTLGNMSKATSLVVSNAGPETPKQITCRVGPGYVVLNIPVTPSTTILTYKVYGSQTSGFTPSSDNLLYEGSSSSVTLALSVAGTWYFIASVVDSFGTEIASYAVEAAVFVRAWVEYDDMELELMKMNFQSISWTQFAIFDSFVDESKRDPADPAPYPAVIDSNSLITNGNEPLRTYQFTSATFNDVTTLETGTGTSGGSTFTPSGKTYWVDQYKNYRFIDSAGTERTINSNTTSTFTLSGAVVSGSYSIKSADPMYFVAFVSYEDWQEGGGNGMVKFEVSFDGGTTWIVALNTNPDYDIDSLQGTVYIAPANRGNDYKVRISLTNDGTGVGPKVKKYLVGTDPSPWLW